jgi:hypothetical protein
MRPAPSEAAMQNKSHAVMSQRTEPGDSPDDFPTPPWATRALIEHVIGDATPSELTCLEPACGAGHMAKVLKEYFKEVRSSDAYDYGYGTIRDYLSLPYEVKSVDWVITNPPFRLAEDFVVRSLDVAIHGVAMLVRSVFLESVGRYNRLFKHNPPTKFAQFVERVPMVKGRLDEKATTATGYAWLVWEHGTNEHSKVVWIPPCRRRLERVNDYYSAQFSLI